MREMRDSLWPDTWPAWHHGLSLELSEVAWPDLTEDWLLRTAVTRAPISPCLFRTLLSLQIMLRTPTSYPRATHLLAAWDSLAVSCPWLPRPSQTRSRLLRPPSATCLTQSELNFYWGFNQKILETHLQKTSGPAVRLDEISEEHILRHWTYVSEVGSWEIVYSLKWMVVCES